MDTLTHALSGALIARAATSSGSPLRLRRCTQIGFLAAAFPDLDYVLTFVGPLLYLNAHQAWTHSFVLLPLWALIVASALRPLFGRALRFGKIAFIAGLAIGVHILGDMITNYGTMIFAPLSDRRIALNYAYVIDPYLSAILLAGLGLSISRPRRPYAAATLLIALGYVTALSLLHDNALAVGKSSLAEQRQEKTSIHALPQPFSPFNWKLIIHDGSGYRQAHMNLYSGWSPLKFYPRNWPLADSIHAYAPIAKHSWEAHWRFGDDKHWKPTIMRVWADARFAAFRHFSVFPALSSVEHSSKQTCVWFTDLRFTLPNFPDPFRFGMCRDPTQAQWRVYRLRWFPSDQRELISK